jgi:hypothetical protein
VQPKGAFFTRGSGHNKYGGYTEDSDEYQEVMDRLRKQVGDGREAGAAPVIEAGTARRILAASAARQPRAPAQLEVQEAS